MQERRLTGFTLAALIGLAVGGASAHAGDYLAWANTEKSGKQALPEDLAPILHSKHATDLVHLEWSEYRGRRPRIRVLTTENESSAATYGARATVAGPNGRVVTYSYDVNANGGNTVPINGLDALVVDILTQTNRFRVVERESLDEIFAEQDLADSGRILQKSAPKVGKALGAEYGIKLVVNSYEPNVKGGTRGLGAVRRLMPGKLGAVAGGVKWANATSRVGITFQLIDLENTEVLTSAPVAIELKSRQIGFGGIGWAYSGAMGGFAGNYSKTPIGQAMIAAINAGTFELIKWIGSKPAEGKVSHVSNGTLTVNLGDQALERNDVLRVFRIGDDVDDPDTGELLYREETEIGKAMVFDVKEKVSLVRPIDGEFDPSTVKVGDVVRATSQVEYEFGKQWDVRGKFKKAFGRS